MEENIYSQLPKLKIELSLTTLVAAVLITIFAFIIPIALIENSKQSNNIEEVVSGPQVMGVSTEKQETARITLPIINQQVKLEGQSGMLIIIGILLILLSFVIVGVLTADSIKKKKL